MHIAEILQEWITLPRLNINNWSKISDVFHLEMIHKTGIPQGESDCFF